MKYKLRERNPIKEYEEQKEKLKKVIVDHLFSLLNLDQLVENIVGIHTKKDDLKVDMKYASQDSILKRKIMGKCRYGQKYYYAGKIKQ